MKNKKFWLGMLVMVLAFGMTVTGCGEEEDNGEFTILNDCDEYSITKIKIWGGSGTDITENVSLTKGQSKSYTLANGDYKYSVEVTFTGEGQAPYIINESILSNQSQKMQYGIDYKHALRAYTRSEEEATENIPAGTRFSWAYNL